MGSIDFFDLGSQAPPASRRLSPRALAGWFESTADAKQPLAHFWSTFQTVRRQERSAHASLVLDLAEQLYIRDLGGPPPNQQALVGPYLKSLPDDGLSELDDGTTPRIESPLE